MIASTLLLAALAACADAGTSPDAASLASSAASVARVSPASASLAAGGRVQLTALASGGEVVAAKWSSSNPGVASVSSAGLVTGVAAGSATITARAGRGQASAAIGVSAAQAPVASVEVAPASAGVAVGGTVQLTATVRDAAGNVLAGRAVAWSSAHPGVATVDAAGVATGVAAGTAAVTATAEGRAGSATLTVSAPQAAPGPVAAECAAARAGWIWCDDFEQDRLARYFEAQSANGSFARAAGVGVTGSTGMRARWATAGQVSAGNLKVAFGRTPSTYFRPVDAGTQNHREIFWRVYVRTEAGWTGGGYKFTRATVLAGSNWQQAMIAHLWTGSSTTFLSMDPASGTDAAGTLRTTTYNDFANLRWLGATGGKTTLFDAAHTGQWQCVEAHVRLNDAGQANGVFEFWVNGASEARRADLNWLGSYSAYGINAVMLENYWNDGAPKAQERYFDNFVVSTQRIGC